MKITLNTYMTKIKASLYHDEWYPVFELTFDENDYQWRFGKNFIEITQADKEKYERIMQEFDDLQTKLSKLSKDKRI